MNEYITEKNKHMSLETRIEIQECLNKGMTFKAIGKRVQKDQTTISKEIKKHIVIKDLNYTQKDSDGNITKPTPCSKLLKAPFVCNACLKNRSQCGHQKQFYYAKKANIEYEELLSYAREGIPLNKKEFYETDRIISEGIEKGQHLYHIIHTNNLKISPSTVYRHLRKGYYSVSIIDFPRVVKFKPRRLKKKEIIPKAFKIGRTYEDFLECVSSYNVSSWVEMDTVIGRIGGKTIMTFDFTLCNFMFGLLLDNKTSLEVSFKFESLRKKFLENHLSFHDIFPIILTDNGGEFANVFAIENTKDDIQETKLFFCDPSSPAQKPRVEKNHTLFRDIAPKGTSFDDFSQDTVNLIFSHVNSIKRKSLNGKTPYEVFAFTFGENVPKNLGIKFVPPKEVIQSPKLIKNI